MITSRVTMKAQTTIPRAVRDALAIEAGDLVGYQIEDDRVILVKANPAIRDDPFAAFAEWAGDIDTKAYADL